MKEIEDYEFGDVYKRKIDPCEAEKFASIFGEGSEALTELIKYCIINNISTFASCKGHAEKMDIIESLSEKGYISFGINNDLEFAYFLSELPLKIKGIEARLEFLIESGKSVTLEVPAWKKGMSEHYFEMILEELKKYFDLKQQDMIYIANDNIRKIVEYIFSYPSLEHIAISSNGYRKYKREGISLKKVARCPVYNKIGILHRIIGNILKEDNDINNFLSHSR